jgi:hypothetical protein
MHPIIKKPEIILMNEEEIAMKKQPVLFDDKALARKRFDTTGCIEKENT